MQIPFERTPVHMQCCEVNESKDSHICQVVRTENVCTRTLRSLAVFKQFKRAKKAAKSR